METVKTAIYSISWLIFGILPWFIMYVLFDWSMLEAVLVLVAMYIFLVIQVAGAVMRGDIMFTKDLVRMLEEYADHYYSETNDDKDDLK